MKAFPEAGDRDGDRVYCRVCMDWHDVKDVEQEKDSTSLHARIKKAIFESAPGFTDEDYSSFEEQAHGISYDVMKALKEHEQ